MAQIGQSVLNERTGRYKERTDRINYEADPRPVHGQGNARAVRILEARIAELETAAAEGSESASAKTSPSA